jgi:hypothetical protein
MSDSPARLQHQPPGDDFQKSPSESGAVLASEGSLFVIRPSAIRRREQRQHERAALSRWCDAEFRERMAAPPYLAVVGTLDLHDPNLWRSNSFAMLRDRLIISVRAHLSDLEHGIAKGRLRPRREQRELPKLERQRNRAREILDLLDRCDRDRDQRAPNGRR